MGGSTITMQVTRNFLLTRERKISRKIRELILAPRVEHAWGKQQILYVFLNEIYLGDGCYGVEAAARNYFDKPVEHLTVAEGALIAGMIAAPNRFNPFKSEKQAQRRKNVVLNTMLKYAFITEEQYEKATSQQLVFRKEERRPFDLAPDFTEVVRRYVQRKYGADVLYNQGLKVFTTCRLDYQQAAVEAVQKGLTEIRERHKNAAIVRAVDRSHIDELLEKRPTPSLNEGKLYQGIVIKVVRSRKSTRLDLAFSKKLRGRVILNKPTKIYKVGQVLAVRFERWVDETARFRLDDESVLQSALVAIENRTGYVRALIGGSTGEKFTFNRATQARRQPGSAFKPIIYAAAIEKKSYSPATIIVDEPIEVELEHDDALWEPKNAGGDFLGPISMRRALELSRNICTIKILMDVGYDSVIDLAQKMGIRSRLGHHLSLSLGTSEVSPLEMTSAYTTFPNGGIHVEPVFIKRIEDRFGNVLEDNTEIPVLDESRIPKPTPREGFKELMPWPAPQQEFDTPEREIKEETVTDTSQPDAKQSENEMLTVPDAPEVEIKPRSVQAVMSPQTAYIMTDLLLGGVRSGTGVAMRKYLKRSDLAGKTGTTNHAKDAWFIGFNQDFTAGVWVGYDEKRPLGRKEYGSRAALPIWGYFMQKVLENSPQKEFPVPPEINFTEMVTVTGNKEQGFYPMNVREPVYAPFVGYTLVLCPVDPPYLLSEYNMDLPTEQVPYDAAAGSQEYPYSQPQQNGEYPPVPQEMVRPGATQPAPPASSMDGRNLFPEYAPGDPRYPAPAAPPQGQEPRPAQAYPRHPQFYQDRSYVPQDRNQWAPPSNSRQAYPQQAPPPGTRWSEQRFQQPPNPNPRFPNQVPPRQY